MPDQDKILHFLRMHGPAIPSKVAKMLNTQILFASALLSDLASQGKIRISDLKIGGSPLYYLPGQEERLHQFAAGNLNPKDLQVLNYLREQKVAREADADLLTKVALRSLKDFAVPLRVTTAGNSELFWRWHLASAEEASMLIRQKLGIAPATETSTPPIAAVADAVAAQSQSSAELSQNSVSVPLPKSAIPDAPASFSPGEVAASLQRTLAPMEEKKTTAAKARSGPKRKSEDFSPKIEQFFRKLKVTIDQKETIRKNSETNFIIKVPSAVGEMRYFCKLRQKARCDEKDLSAAYMEAQMKKLPLFLLYTGELTKKAQEMLDSKTFENIVVRKAE